MRFAFLITLLFAVVVAEGCLMRGDAVPSARGTISGSVRAPGAERTTARREVVVVNTVTGHEYRTHTNDVGDYTVEVPPGRYRVDVTLRPREVLSTRPDMLDVESGGVTADVNIVIAETPQ